MIASAFHERKNKIGQDFMDGLEEKIARKLEQRSLRGDDSPHRVAELQAENTRLQHIVAELLIQNQQLREKVSTP
jgi:hypothetical protein